MVYIIGVISQKGGVGKSTISRLLATEIAAAQFAVKIADLDTQQLTVSTWAKERALSHIKPKIPARGFSNVKNALKDAPFFDVYIIDGRPHASLQTLDIAKNAHLLIIPTGQTKDDLRPAVTLAHNLAEKDISPSKIVFALSKTTHSLSELSAAKEYLQQTPYHTLQGHIPISTAYGISHDHGKSVAETPHPSLNNKAQLLAQSIIDRLALITEKDES